MQSNVAGTWNILESARLLKDQVRSTVIASSDKAYGNSIKLPYDETFPLAGVGLYDVSKSCTDLISKSYADNFKLNVSIARCGNIYGPGDLNWSRIVPGTIRSILRNERPIIRSSGKNLRDYIYIDDILDAYLKLGRLSDQIELAGEAFNFSREEPISVLDMVEEIRKSFANTLLEPKILNQAENEILDQHLDSSKARRILKWKPRIDLPTGLQNTKHWYIQHQAENKM
jgi:CDP-glucose 4,6-dehydratase